MKLKKILAFVLCGAITVGLLGGCSGSEDKKEEDGSKKEAKGGYVEKEIEGPWGEEEIYLGSFLNEEEKLEVYTQTGGDEPQVYSYTQQGEDWEKQKKPGSKSESMRILM